MTEIVKTDRISSHKLLRMSRGGEWLLFSETRRFSKEDGAVLSDTVEIEVHTAIGNKKIMDMRGEASAARDTVSFSNGFIHVAEDWQGRRIGNYMLNRLVTWAKEAYPEWRPVGIKLGHHQAASKESRNRYYAEFGFEFEWENDEHLCGTLKSMRVQELKTSEKWKDEIEEFDLQAGLEKLCRENELLVTEKNALRYQLAHLLESRNEQPKERAAAHKKVAMVAFLAGAAVALVTAVIVSV